MPRHLLALAGALAVVIVVVSRVPTLVAGQNPSAATKTGAGRPSTPPRTSWGDPDLQGVWNYSTITPLERPSALAGKEFLTDAEVAELENQTSRGRIDGERTARPGNVGTYNLFWWEPGTKVIPTKRTSLILDPPDGRIPPLTPDAQKRSEAKAEARRGRGPADSWEDRSAWERCITRGLPDVMIPRFYNNNYQIVQTPGYVVILHEQVHEARFIALDGRPRLGPGIRQWMGDARGHWDGNTLVVDTTNFSDKTDFAGSGSNLHLVERFTRVDADTIDYRFTVDDPTTWTGPWTAAIPATKIQEGIFEYACHEGNYGMIGILGGARVEEKAAEEAAKKISR